MISTAPHLTVRYGTEADRPALQRLAQLDSARTLVEPVLLADLDGVLVAARSLSDGRQVADPFVATADVAALLRTRASQLTGAVGRRFGHRRRPALAPTTT
jgi:hypothetical protein